MAGVTSRLFRHLFAADARNRFPASAMDRIASAIADGELLHGGEVCFAVESTLHWRDVIRGVPANSRARDAFARLRVWDTAANNGVLVYLLLADQRIEIIADRGLQGLVSDEQWRGVCQLLEERLHSGDHADAVVEAINQVSQLLALHFPPVAGVAGQDELPNQPVFL
ncbi:MAG: TPM domain-containing protein [Thermomonas sp.]